MALIRLMRKLPRREMLLGLGLILALAAGHAWYGWQQASQGLGLGGDQLNIGVMSLKLRQPELYQNDYVFADSAFFSFYTPAFLQLAGWLTDLTGLYGTGLALLLLPIIVLYTTGMWRLLQTVTGEGWISLLLAIASAYLAESVGGTLWGVADLRMMIPRSLFLSLAPWWIWLWWRWREQPAWWRRPLLGLLLGLMANLHPVSGLMLSQLFLLTELWWRRKTWRTWLVLGVTALGLLAGVWPTAQTFIRGSDLAGAVATGEDFLRFREALQFSFSTLFPFHSTWLQLWVGPAGQIVLVGWQFLLLLAAAWYGLRGWRDPTGAQPVGSGTRRVANPSPIWLAALLLGELPLLLFLTDGSSPLLLLGVVVLAVGWAMPAAGMYRPDGRDQWALFLLVAVSTLTMVGSFLLEWFWQHWQWWALTSLVGEQARMAKFVYLPLYLLNGRLLAWLWERLAPAGPPALVYLGAVVLLYAVHRPVAILLLLLLTAWFLVCRGALTRWRWLASSLLLLACLLLLATDSLWSLDLGRLLLIWVALVGTLALWWRELSVQLRRRWGMLLGFICLAGWLWLPPLLPSAAALLAPARSEEAEVLAARQKDAQALYQWAAEATPVDAVFYSSAFEFRFYARRAITHSTRDWGTAYYQREGLVALAERWLRLERALATEAALLEAAAEVGADYFYLDRRYPLRLDRPVVYSNAHYIVYELDTP